IKYVVPRLANAITQNSDAYEYLSRTSRGFHTADRIEAMMQEAGFVATSYKTYMIGTMAVHCAQKPTASNRRSGVGDQIQKTFQIMKSHDVVVDTDKALSLQPCQSSAQRLRGGTQQGSDIFFAQRKPHPPGGSGRGQQGLFQQKIR